MSTFILEHLRASGQTIGATTIDLVTYTVPINSSISIVARATLQEVTPAGGLLNIAGSATRGAGTATLNASLTTISSILDAALTTATLTLVRSGNDIIIRGTGIVAKTINWMVKAEIDVYTP